jgi:multidrug transporter EmrE-like cation transporter
MISVVLASCLFATGGALMKISDGFSRPWPSLGVAALFLVGAVVMSRAIRADGLTTAWLLGLGVEAVLSIGVGMLLFSERLSNFQAAGVALVIGGTALVKNA